MADTKTHALKMMRGSLWQLVQMLASPGTFENPGDLYRAGELLEMPELDLKGVPDAKASIDEQRAWGIVEVDLVVTERQRDVLKKAVDHHIKKGAIPPGKYSLRILRELGLAPQD